MTSEHIVYKLQGKSLIAARELERFAEAYWQAQPPIQYPINGADLQERIQQTRAGIIRGLEEKNPALLAEAGLDKPVITVISIPESLPRAYAAWPRIFSTGMGRKSNYFMYAPVGYAGDHFIPEDGVPLDEKQQVSAGHMLYDAAALAERPDCGVEPPANFDPESTHVIRRGIGHSKENLRVFKARGESLAAIEDMQRRQKEYSAASNALFDHVRAMAGKVGISLASEKGETPQLFISSNVAGEGYRVGKHRYGNEFRIMPDTTSEAGKKFGDLLNNPAIYRPDVRDFPVLLYPAVDSGKLDKSFNAASNDGGLYPYHREFEEGQFLVYRLPPEIDPDLPGPPGALPVSPQTFHWLDADATDEMRGITPPPMPPRIVAELASLKPQGGGAQPQPPQP